MRSATDDTRTLIEAPVMYTPRGSEVMRTPRGSEVARTPRGDTNNQKQTLLLPNAIDEEPEEDDDYETGVFKDLRNSAELRVTQGIADKILIAKDEAGSSSSGLKIPRKSKKNKHRREPSREIEMVEVASANNNNNNNKNNENTDEEDDAPGRVPSFKDKKILSILPSFLHFHRTNTNDQTGNYLSLPRDGKATKGTDSADEQDRYILVEREGGGRGKDRGG